MKNNVGKLDVNIRYFLGLVFLVLGIFVHWLFFLLTALMLVTAYTKFCALYKIFGISTCKLK